MNVTQTKFKLISQTNMYIMGTKSPLSRVDQYFLYSFSVDFIYWLDLSSKKIKQTNHYDLWNYEQGRDLFSPLHCNERQQLHNSKTNKKTCNDQSKRSLDWAMLPPHAYDELLLNSPSSQPTPAAAGSWGPFSGAGDFGTTMAIILAALFSTVLLAFSLTAAVRLLLARCHPSAERVDPEKSSSSAAAQVPTTLFSAAGTRLSGAVAECAICLTEFTEGDAVQVLPACNHGFHRRCVEQWLATRGSCPTCRAACSIAQTDGPPDEAQSVEV